MPSPLRAAMIVAACLPSAALAQTQLLTLDDAISRTLAVSPFNASSSARRDALTAARTVAGLGPQPSIDVQAENFGPPVGDLYDQFQITGTYSQKIERGGKRAARVALADRDMELAQAEALVTRLDIIAQVQRLYVEVQSTQAALEVARERLALSQRVAAEVQRRVASAKDPIFAGMRAQAAQAEADVDLQLAVHAQEAALRRLAAMWRGGAEGLAISSVGFLTLDPPNPDGASSPPDLAIMEARGRRADAAIDLQRANAVQDPTLSAGPRYIATGDVGFVGGVSIPIGGRRIAQARMAEAKAERSKAEADLALARFDRDRAVMLAAEKVEESRHEALALRDEVVPHAQASLAEVRRGYNRGFFSFADVSAAQTSLVTVRARMIDAARRYHEAKVELDRLTGRFTRLAQGEN